MNSAIFYSVKGRGENELTDSVISLLKNVNKIVPGAIKTILTERFLHSSVFLEKEETKEIFSNIDAIARIRTLDSIFSFSGMFNFDPKMLTFTINKTIIFNCLPNNQYKDMKDNIEALEVPISSISWETSVPVLLAKNKLPQLTMIPDVSFYNKKLDSSFINSPGIDENTIIYVSTNNLSEYGDLEGLDATISAFNKACIENKKLKLLCVVQNTDSLTKAREIITSIQNAYGVPGLRPPITLTANLRRKFLAEGFKRAKLVILPWSGFNYDFYRKAANMCGTPVIVSYSPEGSYINDLTLFKNTELKDKLDEQYIESIKNIFIIDNIKEMFSEELDKITFEYTAENQTKIFKEIVDG